MASIGKLLEVDVYKKENKRRNSILQNMHRIICYIFSRMKIQGGHRKDGWSRWLFSWNICRGALSVCSRWRWLQRQNGRKNSTQEMASICRNPLDEETFLHDGIIGYNALHINALYDLLNHTYHDVIIQGVKKKDERSAFNSMIDHYKEFPAIFIADRGYESFNTFAHVIHAEQKFLIRLKDISSNGILCRYDLPDKEFDINIDTILTRRRTKECLEHPEIYSILYNNAVFDFIDEDTPYYELSLRVVRFKTDGGYACVATNLPDKTFTTDMIKQLYRLRWNEETSFRELKYTIGLVNYHFRIKEFILQEIYARLILYNFCELVILQTEVKPSPRAELSYRINFATAVNICKEYLKHGGDEDEKMILIQKYRTPIRPNRKYPLNVRPKKNRDFMYRIA